MTDSTDNTTRDRHETRAQAEAVCRTLEREGLGGERIHFPVETWTEEDDVELMYVQGVEGNSIYLNDRRIAGPKPWGGGRVLKRTVRVEDVLLSLPNAVGGRTDEGGSGE